MKHSLFIIVLTSILLIGCKSSEKTAELSSNESVEKPVKSPESKIEHIQLSEIEANQYSGFKTKTYQVINNAETFKKHWETAHQLVLEKPEPPVVNFSENTVILVALGEKNTGGYEVFASHIDKINNQYTIQVQIEQQGSGCLVTEAVTSPYRFYIVAQKISGNAAFREEVFVHNCK